MEIYMAKKYDIAAYIWPAYTGKEPRTRLFWPEGIGEWQSVKNAVSKFDGHSWPRKPLWGYVDEADPYVMEAEIAAAADHGVNVFIYDWYWFDDRPFLENCLNEGYLKANNRARVKFYLMWANHDVNYTWDKRNSGLPFSDTLIWRGRVNKPQFDYLSDRIIEKYFLLDEYYKIDGKPVISIYDIANLVNGLGSVDNVRAALAEFEERAIKRGLPGVHLQFIRWGDSAMNLSGVDGNRITLTPNDIKTLGFDSLTNYQFVHFTDINRTYDEIIPDVLKEWDNIDRKFELPYFPHVSIGWDNNPRFNGFKSGIMRDNGPEKFEKMLVCAKNYVDTHALPAPMITVNSWNEWTETSYLEPDDLYGYGYLEAVKKVFMN